MSDSEDETPKGSESQMGFVTILRDFPIVFSKSQTPNARKSKSQALEIIKKQWEVNFGSQITVNQLLKKINNTKTRLKKKTDLNRTGNRKIILQNWEKMLLEIMEGDTNPVITKIPGAISGGHEQPIPTPSTSTMRDATDESRPPKKKRISPLEEYETDSTKQLSNSELQRLVLLKQLRVLTMKEEKLKRELSGQVSEHSNNVNTEGSTSQNIVYDSLEETTYWNL